MNGSVTNYWMYDENDRVIAELNPSGTIKSRFVYASQAHSPDYMIQSGINFYFIKDQLGSVLAVVNSLTGAVIQRRLYNAFGVVISDSNPAAQPFGFAGGQYDQMTGLVRFGVRDYDANTGRWTAKDPIMFDGGDTNLYGYVMNDPVNYIDTEGMRRGSGTGASGRNLPWNPGQVGPPRDQGPIDPSDFCKSDPRYCIPPFGRIPRPPPRTLPIPTKDCLTGKDPSCMPPPKNRCTI